jgi:hypothetical protein
MSRLRRVLAPLTALWLLCQVGTAVLVPAALRGTPPGTHGTECTCGHGDDMMCPMHHHQPAGRSTPCSMQAVDHSGAAVLTALSGVAGFITAPSRSIEPAPSVEHRHVAAALPIDHRPVPPDPPPPRG